MANFYCVVHKKEEDIKDMWGELTYKVSPIVLFMPTGTCKTAVEAETSTKITPLLKDSKVIVRTDLTAVAVAKEIL